MAPPISVSLSLCGDFGKPFAPGRGGLLHSGAFPA